MGKFEVIVSDISTPIRVVADTSGEAAERVEVATGHTALVVSVVGRGRPPKGTVYLSDITLEYAAEKTE